jgi:hypothetical protein
VANELCDRPRRRGAESRSYRAVYSSNSAQSTAFAGVNSVWGNSNSLLNWRLVSILLLRSQGCRDMTAYRESRARIFTVLTVNSNAADQIMENLARSVATTFETCITGLMNMSFLFRRSRGLFPTGPFSAMVRNTPNSASHLFIIIYIYFTIMLIDSNAIHIPSSGLLRRL